MSTALSSPIPQPDNWRQAPDRDRARREDDAFVETFAARHGLAQPTAPQPDAPTAAQVARDEFVIATICRWISTEPEPEPLGLLISATHTGCTLITYPLPATWRPTTDSDVAFYDLDEPAHVALLDAICNAVHDGVVDVFPMQFCTAVELRR